MRTIYILLLTIFLYPLNVFSGEPDKKLHNECLYPTVMVVNNLTSNLGSGVIIRSYKTKDGHYQNVVLTCAHVVSCIDEFSIKKGIYENHSTFKGYDVFKSYVYYKNSKADLAVMLFTSKNKMPVAALDLQPKLYFGDNVFKIGCGCGDEFRLDEGKITSLLTKIYDIEAYRTSIFTVQGDSGGPVFHNYKIVALISGVKVMNDGFFPTLSYHMSFATPISKLKTINTDINRCIEFCWDKNQQVPFMAEFFLKMKNSDYNTQINKL